jgi:hypothetical protein
VTVECPVLPCRIIYLNAHAYIFGILRQYIPVCVDIMKILQSILKWLGFEFRCLQIMLLLFIQDIMPFLV